MQSQMTDLLHDADRLSEEAYRSRLRYLGRLVDLPQNAPIVRKVRNMGAKRWNSLIQLVHAVCIASDEPLGLHDRNWLESALGYTALHVFISAGNRRLMFIQIMLDELFSGREFAGFDRIIALVAKEAPIVYNGSGLYYHIPPVIRQELELDAGRGSGASVRKNLEDSIRHLDGISRKCTGVPVITHMLYYGLRLLS